MGWRDWLSAQGHLLLFQRTWVVSQHPHGGSHRPYLQFQGIQHPLLRHQEHTWHTYIHVSKTLCTLKKRTGPEISSIFRWPTFIIVALINILTESNLQEERVYSNYNSHLQSTSERKTKQELKCIERIMCIQVSVHASN